MSIAAAPKALIIQDDDGVAWLLAGAFRAAGYRVDEASDGEAGLGMARAGSYVLICVDDNLADMSGIKIMDVLKALAYEGAVFFTSSNPEFARLALAHGADEALLLPLDLDDVTAKARAITAPA